MTFVTSIERLGIQRGKQEGIAIGLEKGLEEGLEKGLQKGLQKGLIRGKKLTRMRLEAQHAAWQATRARHVLQAGEHGLVSEVQAVEIADGDCVGHAEWTKTVGDAHCGRGAEKALF